MVGVVISKLSVHSFPDKRSKYNTNIDSIFFQKNQRRSLETKCVGTSQGYTKKDIHSHINKKRLS